MRYLLDTCILIHYTTDRGLLSRDVYAILDDYENRLYISAETVRELVIQFNKGKLVSKYWKSAEAMIDAIKDEFLINVLPLKEEHMRTYANQKTLKAEWKNFADIKATFNSADYVGNDRYVFDIKNI